MNLNLNVEQKNIYNDFIMGAGISLVFSFLGCIYLFRRHYYYWVNQDIQIPVCKIISFNLIGSTIFLITIVLIDYYSFVELFYDIFLAYFLHVYYNQLIKTLIAYEMKCRYVNNEDPEFFELVKKEDPTSYIFFVKQKNITEEIFKEICLAMALRKIEKGKLLFVINQSFDNMTHCKSKVTAYNNVVKNWVQLTLIALFFNILLNHMSGIKVSAVLHLIRGFQCVLESYLICVLLMISSILSDGTNNSEILNEKKQQVLQEEIEKYDIEQYQTYCFCIKTESKQFKEKMEEMTHKDLSILQNTALEMKFVSIKLIPGTLCSLQMCLMFESFDEENFPNPAYMNLLVFLICSIFNSVMIGFYIYGYDIDKFDFKRYEVLYQICQEYKKDLKNKVKENNISKKQISKMYTVKEGDFQLLLKDQKTQQLKQPLKNDQFSQTDLPNNYSIAQQDVTPYESLQKEGSAQKHQISGNKQKR